MLLVKCDRIVLVVGVEPRVDLVLGQVTSRFDDMEDLLHDRIGGEAGGNLAVSFADQRGLASKAEHSLVTAKRGASLNNLQFGDSDYGAIERTHLGANPVGILTKFDLEFLVRFKNAIIEVCFGCDTEVIGGEAEVDPSGDRLGLLGCGVR